MVKFILSPFFVFIVFLWWTIFWEVSRQKFSKQLKSINPIMWEKLGSPRGLVSRLFVREGFDLEFYLLTRKYTGETDQSLIQEANRLRKILVVEIIILILAIITLLLEWI